MSVGMILILAGYGIAALVLLMTLLVAGVAAIRHGDYVSAVVFFVIVAACCLIGAGIYLL